VVCGRKALGWARTTLVVVDTQRGNVQTMLPLYHDGWSLRQLIQALLSLWWNYITPYRAGVIGPAVLKRHNRHNWRLTTSLDRELTVFHSGYPWEAAHICRRLSLSLSFYSQEIRRRAFKLPRRVVFPWPSATYEANNTLSCYEVVTGIC